MYSKLIEICIFPGHGAAIQEYETGTDSLVPLPLTLIEPEVIFF
jgi:hypothetical protein